MLLLCVLQLWKCKCFTGYQQHLMCLFWHCVKQSLFANIKEEGFSKASSTSSVLQIAVFTQSVRVCLPCGFVCSAALFQ